MKTRLLFALLLRKINKSFYQENIYNFTKFMKILKRIIRLQIPFAAWNILFTSTFPKLLHKFHKIYNSNISQNASTFPKNDIFRNCNNEQNLHLATKATKNFWALQKTLHNLQENLQNPWQINRKANLATFILSS